MSKRNFEYEDEWGFEDEYRYKGENRRNKRRIKARQRDEFDTENSERYEYER
jgi:hypothetical protein